MNSELAITTEKLTKRYGPNCVLDNLDLDVARGEVLGYLGPNGAGKTTTIRCLLGLVRPTSGRATIFGVDAQANPVPWCEPTGRPASRRRSSSV